MLNLELKSKLFSEIEKQDKPREMEHWHASGIAECPKALYLKRKGHPILNKPGSGKILRWQAGHSMETAIRPYLLSLYPKLDSNQRLTSIALDLTGEYDNYDPDSKQLIEIKSVHDYAFKEDENGAVHLKESDGKNARGQNAWKPKLTPYLHHEMQQHAYVLLLEERDIPVEHISYVYLSLSGRMCAYTTEVNPEYLSAVKRRLQVLRTAIETNVAPECVCLDESNPLYGSVLQYCGYRTETNCCEIKEEE